MKKHEVKSHDAPSALGPYSQAVTAAAETYMFVSGQIGTEGGSGDLVADNVQAQTRQCLENLVGIVRAAGGDEASIVKTTVYLRYLDDFASMNEVYSRCFRPPYPARACIGGCDLPKGALVEIDAIAALGG